MDLSGLNPDQRKAVTHTEGPLLVLAGAGSGKTRVITHRIVYLLERGEPAESIVALSFTNKAADEMRERLHKMVGKAADALVLGTFHSLGAAMMREQPDQFGVPKRFSILDQGDVYGIVRGVLRELGYQGAGADRRFDLGAIVQRISLWKNEFITPADSLELDHETDYDEVAAACYAPYEERLKTLGSVDFDDLICRIAHVLEADKQARVYWQAKFKYLMVDEYQDTNRAQFEMVRRLAGARENLCVVGDDDQAIYGWRGAKVANILGFDLIFTRAETIKLEQNYRSYAPILRCANELIGNNRTRHDKKLVPQRRGGEKVQMVVASDGDQENRWVGKKIYNLIQQGVKPEEIAVLYRSSRQCDPVEALLQEHGIAYRVLGGQAFYDKKQVKDVLAYFKMIVAPQDDLAARRAVDVPSRGVGLKSLEHLTEFARRHNLSLMEAMHRSAEIPELPARSAPAIAQFSALIKRAQAHYYASGSGLGALRSLVDNVGLKEAMLREGGGSEAAAAKWDSVEWMYESLERFEQRARAKGGRPRWQEFFQAMNQDNKQDEPEAGGRGQVTLATLHSAKGLEWRHVFLIGVEEGTMPHKRVAAPRISDAIAGDIEEERRLFYVGITRARDQLYITRAAMRLERGAEVPRKPSRFIEELSAPDMQIYEISREEQLSGADVQSMTDAFLARLNGLNTAG